MKIKIWNTISQESQDKIVSLVNKYFDLAEFNNNEFQIPPFVTFLHLWEGEISMEERRVLGAYVTLVFREKGYVSVDRAFSHTINGVKEVAIRTKIFIRESLD